MENYDFNCTKNNIRGGKKNRNVNLFCFLFQFSMLFFKYPERTGKIVTWPIYRGIA